MTDVQSQSTAGGQGTRLHGPVSVWTVLLRGSIASLKEVHDLMATLIKDGGKPSFALEGRCSLLPCIFMHWRPGPPEQCLLEDSPPFWGLTPQAMPLCIPLGPRTLVSRAAHARRSQDDRPVGLAHPPPPCGPGWKAPQGCFLSKITQVVSVIVWTQVKICVPPKTAVTTQIFTYFLSHGSQTKL